MLKIGIIGSGFAAQVHLPAIKMSNYLEVGGVVTKKKIKKIQTFFSIEELLKKKEIDLFLVATPPSTHLSIAKKIIYSKKPIYFEKPFCLNLNEAQKLNLLLKNQKIKHCVGYQFRYEAGLKKLKELLNKKLIGKVTKINIDWLTKKKAVERKNWKTFNNKGASVDVNYLTHCIDYIKWLVNFKILNIEFCNIKKLGSMHNDNLDIYMTLDKKLGVSLRIINNLNSSIGHKIQVIGKKGTLELFWRNPFDEKNTFLTLYSDRVVHYKLFKDGKNINQDTRVNAVKSLWENFYKSLYNKKLNNNLPDSGHAVKIHKYLKELKIKHI